MLKVRTPQCVIVVRSVVSSAPARVFSRAAISERSLDTPEKLDTPSEVGGGCFYAVLFISSVDVIKSAKGAYLEISSASKH
jgi:hypothetical protein